MIHCCTKKAPETFPIIGSFTITILQCRVRSPFVTFWLKINHKVGSSGLCPRFGILWLFPKMKIATTFLNMARIHFERRIPEIFWTVSTFSTRCMTVQGEYKYANKVFMSLSWEFYCQISYLCNLFKYW